MTDDPKNPTFKAQPMRQFLIFVCVSQGRISTKGIRSAIRRSLGDYQVTAHYRSGDRAVHAGINARTLVGGDGRTHEHVNISVATPDLAKEDGGFVDIRHDVARILAANNSPAREVVAYRSTIDNPMSMEAWDIARFSLRDA